MNKLIMVKKKKKIFNNFFDHDKIRNEIDYIYKNICANQLNNNLKILLYTILDTKEKKINTLIIKKLLY